MKNERIPSAKEKDYQRRVNERMPKSKTLSQCIRAFVSGGIICCIGQLIHDFAKLTLNYSESNVAAFTAIVLVFMGATLTGVGIYDKIGAWAGAGRLCAWPWRQAFFDSGAGACLRNKRKRYSGHNNLPYNGPVLAEG